jgi:magnesium transporter
MPSLPAIPSFPKVLRRPRPPQAQAPHDDAIVDCAAYIDGRRVPQCTDPEAALAKVRESGSGFVWVGLYEPDSDDMGRVASIFGLHELAVEDAVHAHQRPKLERYKRYQFLVLKTVRYVDRETEASSEIVDTGEIMMFLGEDFIVTVRHGSHTGLADLRRTMELDQARLRFGPAAVVHAISDRVVDKYLSVVEAVEDDIDEMESAVFSPAREVEIEQIYLLKREVGELRRSVAPLVAPMKMLAHQPNPLVPIEVQEYFRDVEDHLNQVAERVWSFDDMLTTLVSAALAEVTTRQNEDMRKISAWAAIALVPTAIAGIYGMNFDNIPGASSPFGFGICVLAMLAVCLLLYWLLRRRRWL